jgi:hypothetical protein
MSAPQQASGFSYQIPPRYTIRNITGAYTVSGADYGVILSCTGTVSYVISLAPAASLGAGFAVWIWNQSSTSTMVITITPTVPNTIEGSATLLLRPSEGTQIVSTGSAWSTVAKKTMRLYSENSVNASPVKPNSAGTSSFAIGVNASSAGVNSLSLGTSSQSSGNSSVAIGAGCVAGPTYSLALGAAGTPNSIGKTAFGAAYNLQGLQWGTLSLFAATTSNTPTILTSDGGAASTQNQLVLPNNSVYAFNILVVARQQAATGTATAAWQITGLIRQETTASTTALVGSPTITVISNGPSWIIATTADTTNGGLAITVTGAPGTNIYWLATIQTSEITYS